MTARELVAKAAYEEMVRRQGYDPRGMGPAFTLRWEDQNDRFHEDWMATIAAAESAAVQAERARCERIADVFAKAIGEGECAATMRKVGLEIWNHIHGGEAWPPPPGASASESTVGG
jgi:hypothetical protein